MSKGRGSSPASTAFTSTRRAAATRPSSKPRGGHFNPTGASHGLFNLEGPHAGDLINLNVGEDGTVTYVVSTERITLTEGERAILDSDGSAVIIHAQADNYLTDPGGSSGDRIACGVIEQE